MRESAGISATGATPTWRGGGGSPIEGVRGTCRAERRQADRQRPSRVERNLETNRVKD